MDQSKSLQLNSFSVLHVNIRNTKKYFEAFQGLIESLNFIFYITNIYTFENKNQNHQVSTFLGTWDLNQQEPVQTGY